MTYNYLSVHSGAAIDSAVARALKLPIPTVENSGSVVVTTSSNYGITEFSTIFDEHIGEIKLTSYTTPIPYDINGNYYTTPVSALDTIPSAFKKVQSQIWNTVNSINHISIRPQEKGNIYIVDNNGYMATAPLDSTIRQNIGASRVTDDGTGLKIITD